MSPILIAILAVYCCIVGFVMGRMTAKPSLHVVDVRQVAALSNLGVAAKKTGVDAKLVDFVASIPKPDRVEYAKRASVSQGEMAVAVYGRVEP